MSQEKLRLQLRHENSLGFWRDMIVVLYGAHSPAIAYLDRKIAKDGPGAQVQAPFGQFMGALNEIHRGLAT